ncbi:MAG: T9SS C-terminal target domain-containing protein [Bacteroidia bacterium]|nr:MAG: T9SS C-terminal target domain-containing protein [Bacteroidia bacterium]
MICKFFMKFAQVMSSKKPSPGKFSAFSATLMSCLPVGLFVLLLIYSHNMFSQSVIINEVMASNATTIADEDGDYEDWIELHNYGDEPVDLTGFGLSDSYNDPFRFIFPDAVIAPGGYLLVWASGKNRDDPDAPLHTVFSISSAGEEVLLTASSGVTIDVLEAVNIPTDISIGRKPDDLSGWYFFDEPTPGSANTGVAWQGIAEAPGFSHPGGFYDAPFHLELSAADDILVFYTLDGSVPDSANVNGSSFVYKNQYPTHPGNPVGPFLEHYFQTFPYTEPIPVENQTGSDGIHQINTSYTGQPLSPSGEVMQGMIVRARAYREGYLPGPVITNTYLVKEGIHQRFDLPVVSLTIPDSALFDYYRGIYVAGEIFDNWRQENPDEPVFPGVRANWRMRGFDWEREMYMEMFDNEGALLYRQGQGARIHGGWSRSNPKKSLRVYARNIYDNENEINYTFFPGDGRGLDDKDTDIFKRLMLRAGGNGNRIFRDVVAHDFMMNTNIGVMRARPAVHFVNGVYWGMVNFRDRQDRYHIAFEYDIDPGNVIMIDSPHQITDISKLEEGVPEDLDFFNDFFLFVTENDMSDDELFLQAQAQMDMDSYMDYYIMFIYLANTDWGGRDNVGRKHFRFWRVRDTSFKPYQDGKWRMLVWDFDNAFSDVDYDLLTDVMDSDNEPSAMILSLMENDSFRSGFINRLADLMNTHFLPDYALDVIDQRIQAVEHEVPFDMARWNRNPLFGLEHVKSFMRQRPDFQKAEMMEVFHLPDTNRVTLRTNPSRGHIRINTIDIKNGTPGVVNAGDWTGTYFQGVPVEIEAVPLPGMMFSHWDGLPEGTPARTTIYLEQDTVLTAHFWDGVIHYWHFNYLPDDDFVETVNPDFSLFPDDALISYPGEGSGYMDRVYPGTDVNVHMDADSGFALRVRNPSDTRSLLFHLPGNGHRNLNFSYALQRTHHGPEFHSVCFSADGGNSWTLLVDDLKITTDFELQSFDLGEHPQTNDNPDLLIRILFTGESASNLSGNVRLDNVVLKTVPLKLEEMTLPGGQPGVAYTASIGARNGLKPYHYRLVEGHLPEGLELLPDGKIVGTPLRAGTGIFTVELTDASQAYDVRQYMITVYDHSLIHYWHFNDPGCEKPDTVIADFSATVSSKGVIHYPGMGDGYLDYAEGTLFNSLSGVPAGTGLRVRNPSATRYLQIHSPSEGFEPLELSFAVHRTNQGARRQQLQYSPDGGGSWFSMGGPYLITTDYRVKTFHLDSYHDMADNADLMFRVFFLGEEAANTSGNNRFDNIIIRGIPLKEQPGEDRLLVYPNPVTDGIVYLVNKHNVRVYDVFGSLLHQENNTREIWLPPLASGIYFIVTDTGRHARIMIP